MCAPLSGEAGFVRSMSLTPAADGRTDCYRFFAEITSPSDIIDTAYDDHCDTRDAIVFLRRTRNRRVLRTCRTVICTIAFCFFNIYYTFDYRDKQFPNALSKHSSLLHVSHVRTRRTSSMTYFYYRRRITNNSFFIFHRVLRYALYFYFINTAVITRFVSFNVSKLYTVLAYNDIVSFRCVTLVAGE